MYKVVKRYYDKGIYSDEDVAKFVVARRLTAEEYKSITGSEYNEA